MPSSALAGIAGTNAPTSTTNATTLLRKVPMSECLLHAIASPAPDNGLKHDGWGDFVTAVGWCRNSSAVRKSGTEKNQRGLSMCLGCLRFYAIGAFMCCCKHNETGFL